jgi:hypothetical protein
VRAAGRGLALSALLFAPGLSALAQEPPREPQLLSPQQIEQGVGERLGVRVLAVQPVETAGGTRYAVKVMNPPGNYNAALLVTTLLVDGTSGEILREVESGSDLARPAGPETDTESGPEARRRTYR